MVTVAAVALGSSTYAWFVNSNKVDATTNNISAQSNSAYLVIDNAKAGNTSDTSTTSAVASEKETSTTTALYPAQWDDNFNAEGTAVESNGVYQFETAYAKEKDKATENDGTRFVVGTPATAVEKEYALLNTFYVGTGTYDGEFTNLKVTNMTVTTTEEISLKTAMRLLIMTYAPAENGYATTNTGWAVVKTDGTNMTVESQSGTDGIIYAPQFGKEEGDVKVEIYAYYDGADTQVFTTQLDKLTSCGANVFFEATPAAAGK